MTRTTRTIEATPDQVWAVLADGWLYPLWVVGATMVAAPRWRTTHERNFTRRARSPACGGHRL